jgi:hypothetical protein
VANAVRHRFFKRKLTTERYRLSESAVDTAFCRRTPNKSHSPYDISKSSNIFLEDHGICHRRILIALSPTPAGICLSAKAFSATADGHPRHPWSKNIFFARNKPNPKQQLKHIKSTT